MSKFTRRSIPALLASTAGLVSTALTAGPGIDPVYAAIANVAAANRDYIASLHDQESAERRCWAAKAKLTAPTHGGVTLRRPEDVDSCLNRQFLKVHMRAALWNTFRHSDNAVGLALATKFEATAGDIAELREQDAFWARLHAEVAAFEAECERLRRTTGLHDAEARAHELGDIRYGLSKAALATIPVTQAGAAALASFALSEAEELGNDEVAVTALATLATFFSRHA